MTTASAPYFQPKKYPLSATAKVWRVKGIPEGEGMAMRERTEIIAAKSAALIWFLMALFFMSVLFLHADLSACEGFFSAVGISDNQAAFVVNVCDGSFAADLTATKNIHLFTDEE